MGNTFFSNSLLSKKVQSNKGFNGNREYSIKTPSKRDCWSYLFDPKKSIQNDNKYLEDVISNEDSISKFPPMNSFKFPCQFQNFMAKSEITKKTHKIIENEIPKSEILDSKKNFELSKKSTIFNISENEKQVSIEKSPQIDEKKEKFEIIGVENVKKTEKIIDVSVDKIDCPNKSTIGKKRNSNKKEVCSLPLIGLVNLGTTCYVNAFIQIFLRTPFLLDYFKKHIKDFKIKDDSSPISQILYLEGKYINSNVALKPSKFIEYLKTVDSKKVKFF